MLFLLMTMDKRRQVSGRIWSILDQKGLRDPLEQVEEHIVKMKSRSKCKEPLVKHILGNYVENKITNKINDNEVND